MASKPRNTPAMPFPGESPTISLAMAAGQKYGLQPEKEKKSAAPKRTKATAKARKAPAKARAKRA